MSKDRKAGIYDFPNEKYPRTFQSLFELIEHDTKTKLPDSSRSAIQEYFGYRHQERTTLEKQKQTAKAKIEKKEQPLKTLTQEDLEKGLTDQEQTIFFKEEKPFTVQSVDKTDPDLRILRQSNHGMHSIQEIVESLEAIANASRYINLSDHQEACLYNAIEILENTQEKEKLAK